MIRNLKTQISITLLLLLALLSGSCKKNELGGKASVEGTVKHHSKAIANAVVYIKFDAKEFPGSNTGNYDAKVNADANGYYKIPDFYKGEYYLYAVGYDYAIPPPYVVVGGLAVKLRNKEHLKRDISVTEGD